MTLLLDKLIDKIAEHEADKYVEESTSLRIINLDYQTRKLLFEEAKSNSSEPLRGLMPNEPYDRYFQEICKDCDQELLEAFKYFTLELPGTVIEGSSTKDYTSGKGYNEHNLATLALLPVSTGDIGVHRVASNQLAQAKKRSVEDILDHGFQLLDSGLIVSPKTAGLFSGKKVPYVRKATNYLTGIVSIGN